MKIRYEPLFTDFPPLVGVRPAISDVDRDLAKLSRPPAMPLHCKPWVDASSYGLLLRFPYKATVEIVDTGAHPPTIRISPRSASRVYGQLAYSFAPGHVGVSSGYWLKTDPGVGTFTNILPHGYPPKGALVPGLVETWRYPKNLFIVFKCPGPGETITFEHGDPLCVLIPVLCEPVTAERMSPDDVREFAGLRERWREHLAAHPELYWTSRDGETFTHAYKALADRGGGRTGPVESVSAPPHHGPNGRSA